MKTISRGGQKKLFRGGIFLAVALALVLVGVTSRWVYRQTLDGLIDTGNERMTLYTGTLRSALRNYAYLPYVLATDQNILDLLHGRKTAAEVNHMLATLRQEAGCEALYIMNDQGTTLASSNWHEPLSFVGHNYGFRPYFTTAKEGQKGRYFAIGATTGNPGYFMSHPIWEGERIIGVAAVKIDLTDLQDEWREGGETVLVSDVNGVLFLSSYQSWKYRTLAPLNEAQRILIQATRQYGRQPLDLLPLEGVEVVADGQRIVELAQTRYLMMSRSLHDLNWQIHYLLRLSPAAERSRAVAIIGTVLILFLFAFGMYVRERRQKLLSRHKAREAEALLEVNKRLQDEIAEHNRTEKALRETQAELVQSSKLAALGHMAAGIVHELNQPIAAIRTHAASGRLLLERRQFDKAQTTLSSIARMTEHLASITVQLKTFAHKAPPAGRELVVVQECIEEAVMMTAALFQDHQVTLVREFSDQPVCVSCCRGRIKQVLINLIKNAIDSMRTVTLRRLVIAVDVSAERVDIAIRDSGGGIRTSAMNEIFTPFFTTKEVGEGLGLGLSISYRIVTDLGGLIRASNNSDAGATFVVSLPRPT
jgi:two-component system C4-dicarboxylate transport sensor histidine kinase DctB